MVGFLVEGHICCVLIPSDRCSFIGWVLDFFFPVGFSPQKERLDQEEQAEVKERVPKKTDTEDKQIKET